MSVRGTWQITIKRTDGSERRYTEFLRRGPHPHEVIERQTLPVTSCVLELRAFTTRRQS